MTPVDIMHAIVSTEETARALYTDAKEKEESFAARLEEETVRLRAETATAAEAEIAAFDAEETARADRAIAELDRVLTEDLARAGAVFEKRREELTSRVFSLAAGSDA